MTRILYLISVIILFLLSSALRVLSYKANLYNISIDECHNLTDIGQNCLYLFTHFIPGANSLPLYRFSLHLIHNFFGFNFPIYKSISLLCGILSYIVFYKVISKLFNNKIIILALLIVFTFNYCLIVYSYIIKVYEAEMLAVLILLYGALEIYNKYRDTQIPVRIFTIYSIVSVIIMYTALTGIVIIELYWLVFFIYWIKTKNIVNIKKCLLFQAVTVPFLLIEYLTYIVQMVQDTSVKGQWHNDTFYFSPNSLDAVNALINISFYDFVPYDSWYSVHFPKFIICLLILIFIIGSILFLIPIFKKERNFSGIFIILPVYFFMFLSFLGIYPFCNRLIIFLIPFFLVILFKFFDIKNSKYIIVSYVLTIIFTRIFLYHVYSFHNINNLIIDKTSINIEKINDRLENTKPNELIISAEYICINCLNNNNSVIYLLNNEEIKDKNQTFDFYDRRNNSYYKSTIKDLIKGYDTIIFAYNSGDNFTFTEPLKKLIINEGYKEIINDYDKDYIDYAELKK